MEVVEQKLEGLMGEFKSFLGKFAEEKKLLGDAQDETKAALAGLKTQIDEIRAYQTKPAASEEKPKSLTEMFIECQQFKAFMERGWHKGGAAMKFGALPWQQKTTITTSTVGRSTPGILVPERVPGIVGYPQRSLRVRDLIPFGTVSGDAVEYVKEDTLTNAASPQTEGSDKAESALTFTIEHAHVQTLAHWIPATRQVLDDFSLLQSYIETRLMEGLKDIEDYELLRGDNTGLHLNGLITAATAYAGTYDAASDTRIDKLNHAIAELNANGYVPTGIVLSPQDWRVIEVIKTNEGGANLGPYILGGPRGEAAQMLWGLPVALTREMQTGKFLVGDFRTYCGGFDRMDARIDISTEHSDYFIKNMVAIRCEERLTLAIYRGAAFRYGTF